MSLYSLVFPVHFLGSWLITFRISCSCFQIWMTYPPLFSTDLGQVVRGSTQNEETKPLFKIKLKADPQLVELMTMTIRSFSLSLFGQVFFGYVVSKKNIFPVCLFILLTYLLSQSTKQATKCNLHKKSIELIKLKPSFQCKM